MAAIEENNSIALHFELNVEACSVAFRVYSPPLPTVILVNAAGSPCDGGHILQVTLTVTIR